MFRKITSIALAGLILSMSSCASIVSKSNYPISIYSSPSEAKITITDGEGDEVYVGNTPANLKLKAGAGFFKKASYSVTLEKEGYETVVVPVYFSLDGWYLGNLLIGGVLGFLIIDPATGAMYKLDTDIIDEKLSPKENASVTKNGLEVYDVNAIPEQWKAHLVEITK